MAGRESAAVERAVERALAGETISGAARAETVAVQSVRRALRRRAIPGRAPVCGPAHHAYIDGRKSTARD